jgi:hypothetical protein
MALTIGALRALAVGLLGIRVGLDRDRSLYPVVTIVVASYNFFPGCSRVSKDREKNRMGEERAGEPEVAGKDVKHALILISEKP